MFSIGSVLILIEIEKPLRFYMHKIDYSEGYSYLVRYSVCITVLNKGQKPLRRYVLLIAIIHR